MKAAFHTTPCILSFIFSLVIGCGHTQQLPSAPPSQITSGGGTTAIVTPNHSHLFTRARGLAVQIKVMPELMDMAAQKPLQMLRQLQGLNIFSLVRTRL